MREGPGRRRRRGRIIERVITLTWNQVAGAVKAIGEEEARVGGGHQKKTRGNSSGDEQSKEEVGKSGRL